MRTGPAAGMRHGRPQWPTTACVERGRRAAVLALALTGLAACRPAPQPGASRAVDRLEAAGATEVVGGSPFRPRTLLGLDEYFAVPDSNPLTAAKVELGRRLFFDARLSRDASVACASCHRPDLAFADTVRFSRGAHGRAPTRNTPSLVNRAYGRSFFRDGRTPSLEQTVLKPVVNPVEMNLPLGLLLARLEGDEGYRTTFARIFPDVVTEANIARALASYVRVLRSGDAPFDRFAAGDTLAISAQARRGFRLFVGRANCSRCHAGPLLSDGEFHNTGVSWGSRDTGRFAVTATDEDRGRFRTPSLRDVALTRPYMHDGSLSRLEEVIEFYDRGGGSNPYLDREIRPLSLSDTEKRSLIAFLESLIGDPRVRRSP